MSRKTNLIGKKFNRLLVQEETGRDKFGRVTWTCLCDCGKFTLVPALHLKSGNTKSCGCYKIDKTKERLTKHGCSKKGENTKEYNTWLKIKDRIFNENCKAYPYYMGRGIKMQDSWVNSFENFLNDVGVAPSPKHSIDRIDNNGDYTKENVRWATAQEQANNTRHNHVIEYNGKRMNISEWARELGIKRYSIHNRLKLGWPIERVFTEPVHKKKNR